MESVPISAWRETDEVVQIRFPARAEKKRFATVCPSEHDPGAYLCRWVLGGQASEQSEDEG